MLTITTETTLGVMAQIIGARRWMAPTLPAELMAQPTWWLPGATTPVTIHAAYELALRELHGAEALPLEVYGLQWAMPYLTRAAGEPLALWECTPKRRTDQVLSLLDDALCIAKGQPVPNTPRVKHPASLHDVKSRLSLSPIDGVVSLDGAPVGTITLLRGQTRRGGFGSVLQTYHIQAVVEGKEIDLETHDLASASHWTAVKVVAALRDAMARVGVK
jgi:hypothetical protein